MTAVERRTWWQRVRWALAYEVGMYRSLARWVARRPSLGGPDARPHGYARLVGPMLWLWIFGSAVEVVVLHVLIPWPVVQLVALVLGVWGLVWMLGLLASYRVFPHLLERDRLRVRSGALVDVAVPWAAVESVGTGDEDLESSIRSLQPIETERGTHLRVGVSGRVNVHLTLVEPTQVRTPRGPMTIVRLSLWADDPRDLARDVRAAASA
ncbi:hypothetical protein [Solicola sp. PLA-1-18]|uniref:hypothetical protein n=1 Tax=Solicola sp. PLA-1-18 TaxID=3380532 RepID=UPI003B808E1A